MGILEKHSEVVEALDIVLGELAEECQNIYQAGGEQLAKGNVNPALKAIDCAKRLDAMRKSVGVIRDQWVEYLKDVDQESADVREILRWRIPTKEREGGTRIVGEVSPWTAIAVKFPDGEEIQERTAKETFAKVVSRLGAEKVADLGILVARQPLVARERTGYDGPKTALAPIDGGWTVRTDFSTQQKARYLKGIAEALGQNLEISVVSKSGEEVPDKTECPRRSMPTGTIPQQFAGPEWKGQREVDGIPSNLKVSEVVKTWFPLLFARNLITDEELEFFLTEAASSIFKTGGRAVLLENRGCDGDRYSPLEDGTMHARFYDSSKVDLRRNGRRFYLSSQFMPQAMGPLVHYLESKGISRTDMLRAIEAFRN